MTAQLALPLPTARLDDPDTSREAARSVEPGNEELIRRIRAYTRVHGPLSHEEIAFAVMEAMPGRWTAGTIVSACARAGLTKSGLTAINRRGRRVALWRVEESTVRTIDVL
jgi:hypothetical protein